MPNAVDPLAGLEEFFSRKQRKWKTLLEVFQENDCKLPLLVEWQGGGGGEDNPVKLLFTDVRSSSDGAQYILHPDYRVAGEDDLHCGFALLACYRLLPLALSATCNCDYRNVILVSGCKCGKDTI